MNASVKMDPGAAMQRLRGHALGLVARAKEDLPGFFREYRLALAVTGAVLLALIVTLLLWGGSEESDLRPLYGRQEMYNTAAVIEVLDTQGASYSLHPGSGQILVPRDEISSARMLLATAGITPEQAPGMELLSADGQLGRSQFVERKQYLEGLEGELSQTISSLRPVRSARVHLAVPERTSFLRDQVQPSASVYLDLYSGVSMNAQQVQGILNLVSGSLPDLDRSRVSILDQNSNPLTGIGGTGDVEADRQLQYVQRLEQQYMQRLSRLIEPLVGAGNLRVAVNVDVDFSFQEDSVEAYDPDSAVLRSESYSGTNSATGPAGGVPGAAANVGDEAPAEEEPESSVSQIRNYELERNLSYRRKEAYSLERVNVAVILNSRVPGLDGDEAAPLLESVDELLRNAAGVDLSRGDQVSVQALPFFEQESASGTAGLLADASENSRTMTMLIMAVLVLLVIAVLVFIMVMRKRRADKRQAELEQELLMLKAADSAEENQEQQMMPASTNSADRVRDLARSNPDQVASIIERWLKEAKS